LFCRSTSLLFAKLEAPELGSGIAASQFSLTGSRTQLVRKLDLLQFVLARHGNRDDYKGPGQKVRIRVPERASAARISRSAAPQRRTALTAVW
jgi:hypothetical protein